MNHSNPCYAIVDNKLNNDFLKKETGEYFTILPKVESDVFTRLAQTVMRRDTYMEENFEIYQSIRTFITRKGIEPEKRAYFEKNLELMIEGGFSSSLFDKFGELPSYIEIKLEKVGGQDGFLHYNGLQNYIVENTKVTALMLDKLDYLFRVYFAFVIVVLLLSLANYCFTLIGYKVKKLFFRIISFS